MNGPVSKLARCAIYTRKSTEYNLELAFNSLDAQREACEAYIKSQAHEGWRLIPGRYDDGAFSGASLDRPALQQLLADVRAGKIDIVLVYKVDRLTRSLADFAKLIELFDAHGVSFVSVTQSFNTSSSMGRLTLNVLLSFAQFERELIGERVRDKIAASKRKGLWVGGPVPLGYAAVDKKILVVPAEASQANDVPVTGVRHRRVAQSKAIMSGSAARRWRVGKAASQDTQCLLLHPPGWLQLGVCNIRSSRRGSTAFTRPRHACVMSLLSICFEASSCAASLHCNASMSSILRNKGSSVRSAARVQSSAWSS